MSKSTIKRNRFFGLVIILIIVVPMIIAYIMFHTGMGLTGSTTNKGVLLEPPQKIQTLPLFENENLFNVIYAKNEHGKKWRLLVPVSAVCNKACENNLYLTRQVHIRLAEKGYRVERVVAQLDLLPEPLINTLSQDHPNTLKIKTSRENLSQWLARTNAPKQPENYIYLIDQEGFAMMFYDETHSGQDLLDDIKKLLKFTYDK